MRPGSASIAPPPPDDGTMISIVKAHGDVDAYAGLVDPTERPQSITATTTTTRMTWKPGGGG